MLFGKKKSEEMKEEDLEPQHIKLPTFEEIKSQVESSSLPTEEEKLVPTEVSASLTEIRPEETRKIEMVRLGKAPLFIKLERYEEVLSMTQELKSILVLLKDSLSVLDENEKIRSEAVKMIRENIENFEEKVASLDSILLKPSEKREISEVKSQRTEEVKDSLSALKSQIDKLKEELESLK